jgi:hypothetical protein
MALENRKMVDIRVTLYNPSLAEYQLLQPQALSCIHNSINITVQS